MNILILIIAVILALLVGIAVGYKLKDWKVSKATSSGTIRLTKTDEKSIFSLELDGDPEELEFRDKVIFKVEKSAAVSKRI